VTIGEIRDHRDRARQLVKQGVNPNDHKKAERIEFQAKIETTIADAERRDAETRRRGDAILAAEAEAHNTERLAA
jgi:hypothetical protein